MKIFIDVETIPDQTPGALKAIRDTIRPPGNITKPESIAKWMTDNADDAAEKEWRKTALSGTSGELIVIGVKVDNGATRGCYRNIGQSEINLINGFWLTLKTEIETIFPEGVVINWENLKVEWIGHNVPFDLRFIYQRSVIHGIRPKIPIPHTERHGYGRVFDTMQQWAGHGNYIKLGALCEALGIESPKDEGMDGSKVFDAWRAGNAVEVAKYCKRDVEATREVYKRLNFMSEDRT